MSIFSYGLRGRALAYILHTHKTAYFLPLTLMRVALGLFFFASGFNKLFLAENRAAMLDTITEAGILYAKVVAPLVAVTETLFGISLAIGLLSRLSALVLLIISTVALLTVGIYQIPEGQTGLGWYSWILYLPESLYMLICFVICIQGSGPFGLDARLCRVGNRP